MKKGDENSEQETIIEAAKMFKDGDAEAFEFLYNRFKNMIYRLCLKMLGDEELAKDCFHESFLKAYEHRTDIKPETFHNWLYTIAHNTCINYLRKQKRQVKIGNDDYGFKPRGYLNIGMKEAINEKIQLLPILLREALILRDYEDLTYESIAEILKIDKNTALVRVHRARLKLKELLAPLVKELNESN
ncbi:MAG TPA: RNA polymerase sigma factor [Bacteroidota bacterium]|nr:RNA polymerase sigma factor [Bacteroidota bacterium]